MTEITFLYIEDRNKALYRDFLAGSTVDIIMQKYRLCKRYVQAIIRQQGKKKSVLIKRVDLMTPEELKKMREQAISQVEQYRHSLENR